jgi:tetratricopeptide (TPR) repeat protein
MNARRILALTLASTLALALPALGQDWKGKARMGGVVTDTEDKPLAGVKVTAQLGGQGPAAVSTNDKGEWEIGKLAYGDWSVKFEALGFEPVTGPIKLDDAQSAPNLTVKLAKEDLAVKAINAGATAYNAGDRATARAEYEKALAALPPGDTEKRVMVQRMLAQIDLLDSKPQQAVARAQELAAADPQNVELLKLLAQAQLQANDQAGAIETLKKVATMAPDDAKTLDYLIGLLVEAGKLDEAETYLAKMPAGAPLDPVTLLNLGINYYNAKQYDKAMAKFDRVIQDHPERTDVYYFRGQAHLALKHNAQAKADFEKLLALAPNYAKSAEVKEILKKLG